MHLTSMVHHLVLARKRTVTPTFTTNTPRNRTPEYSLFSRMCPIIMPIEVVPASECAPPASWERAVEDEDLWVTGRLNSADVGGWR